MLVSVVDEIVEAIFRLRNVGCVTPTIILEEELEMYMERYVSKVKTVTVMSNREDIKVLCCYGNTTEIYKIERVFEHENN